MNSDTNKNAGDEIPEDVSSAWASVLISIWKKRKPPESNEDDASRSRTGEKKRASTGSGNAEVD